MLDKRPIGKLSMPDVVRIQINEECMKQKSDKKDLSTDYFNKINH